MTRINRKHRRGLSSVVGAVFMILVMIGALNVILLAMQQQDKVTQAVVERSNSSLSKLNEEITISEIKITSSNKLNMTVANSGGSVAKLASIYIVNETASPKEQYRYDLNNIPVDGRTSQSNIGATLPLNVKTLTKYSVKIVTEGGNTATSGITPVSSAALPMSLTPIPPSIPPGQNMTLLFTVTNNITDSTLAWPVTPTISHNCVAPCQLTPFGSNPPAAMISQGNTALFKWTYKVESTTPDETQITFTASVENAKPGNFVTEKALVKVIETSETTIIVNEELIQKPELFFIAPGPFGDNANDASLGLWGISVVNPTNYPLDVNRVWIAAYTSSQSGAQVFWTGGGAGTGCDTDTEFIFPSNSPSPYKWTCPHDNLLMWANPSSPVVIPAYGVQSWVIRLEPGSLNQGPEPGFNLNAGVYTSLGQFAKTGISSTMDSTSAGNTGPQSVANVYLTDITDPALISQVVQNSHMRGNKTGIPENTDTIFSVAFADLDANTDTKIKSGAKLIINVPPKFGKPVVDCLKSVGFVCAGPLDPVIVGPFSDDSWQIIATTLGDTGGATGGVPPGTGSPGAKMLVFTSKAPDISTGTKVYIMHVLADGETTTSPGWSVSPLGQIVLQVVG